MIAADRFKSALITRDAARTFEDNEMNAAQVLDLVVAAVSPIIEDFQRQILECGKREALSETRCRALEERAARCEERVAALKIAPSLPCRERR